MTASSHCETKTPASRRLPVRFSLRLLLLAVTAFAIGFPVWYRWPYEEEDLEFTAKHSGNPRYVWKRYVTWQRQWGGGRKKHGPERERVDGKLKSVTTWRDVVKHGPYAQYGRDGELLESGEYENDEPTGTWIRSLDGGLEVTRSEYRGNQLWRVTSKSREGVERQIEFDGQLRPWKIVINGREVEDRLARLAAEGKFDNPRIANGIGQTTIMEFAQTPLKDTIAFLSVQHQVPIRLDPVNAARTQPISEWFQGIPLSTALTVLTASRDLGCDYRYGCIWVTSAEDAKDWHDPTGVADIVPPPDSQLARSWNEPVAIEVIDQPLADVIDKQLIVRLGIAVDASRIAPSDEADTSQLVTFYAKGQPFRHVLGMLLYQTRCRCRLDGETLVILPPELP